jgi:hypothetical protein
MRKHNFEYWKIKGGPRTGEVAARLRCTDCGVWRNDTTEDMPCEGRDLGAVVDELHPRNT